MKRKYRPLSKSDTPLVCFVAEHGNGMNRQYLVLLSSQVMQEIDLSNNTCRVYEQKDEPLAEYANWKNGKMKEQGYRQCPVDHYLLAQNTLEARLKESAAKKPSVRHTHFRNFQLS